MLGVLAVAGVSLLLGVFTKQGWLAMCMYTSLYEHTDLFLYLLNRLILMSPSSDQVPQGSLALPLPMHKFVYCLTLAHM